MHHLGRDLCGLPRGVASCHSTTGFPKNIGRREPKTGRSPYFEITEEANGTNDMVTYTILVDAISTLTFHSGVSIFLYHLYLFPIIAFLVNKLRVNIDTKNETILSSKDCELCHIVISGREFYIIILVLDFAI